MEFIAKKAEELDKKEKDDGFFVCDLDVIRQQLENWKKNLPRIKPFYAVKSCPVDAVIKLLADENSGFDCASKGELEAVLDHGVHPNDIVYAHPIKQITHLKYAKEKRVTLLTFDSHSELFKIKEYHPDAKCILRIYPMVEDKNIENKRLGFKQFGCLSEEIPSLIDTAKTLGLNVIGASFHVAFSPTIYALGIRICKKVFEECKAQGMNPYLLDIGGGFPGRSDDHHSFEQIAVEVNQCLDEYFPADSGVQIIAEPGRFFVTQAFQLVVKVIGRREFKGQKIKENFGSEETALSNSDRVGYFLSDGIFQSFRYFSMELFPRPFSPIPIKITDSPLKLSTLYGQGLTDRDVILRDIHLPKLEIGDWLMFPEMGAYTYAMQSNFMSLCKKEVFSISQLKEYEE